MSDVRDLFERLTDVEPGSSASAVLARAEVRARGLARQRKQRAFAAVGVVAVLIVGAVVIAAGAGRGRGSRPPIAATTTTTAPPVTAVSYEVNAEVEQDAPGDPVLCLGAQLKDLGRLCGGVPIAGWDWSKVTGQKTVNGLTSGGYHLVGTYDGTTFTVTAPPGPFRPAQPAKLLDFAPPCPTPAGGWVDVDPSRMTERDYERFSSAAQGQPDSAGLWVDNKMPVNGAINPDPAREVNTVAFTGNLEHHRAELRALWGGPMCVVRHQHSTAELDGILSALTGNGGQHPALGARFGGGTDPVDDLVSIEVVAATPAMQQAVDRKYGAGVVKLVGLLTPVPAP